MTTGIFIILLSVMLKILKRPGYDLCTLGLTQIALRVGLRLVGLVLLILLIFLR